MKIILSKKDPCVIARWRIPFLRSYRIVGDKVKLLLSVQVFFEHFYSSPEK